MTTCTLPDTQSKIDNRNIIINQVGIKDIIHPIIFIDKDNNPQHTVGNFTMTVELPAHIKGTHMSRFIEILNVKKPEFSTQSFIELLQKVSEKLNTPIVQVQTSFSFFRNKIAPKSKAVSMLDYQVIIKAYTTQTGQNTQLKVIVPVTSLCPCSKSISKYGAHNQRSHISINILMSHNHSIYVEDLIDIAESSASSELYAVLKREDEKLVTERAYENPAFVEDLVRDIAQKLNQHPHIVGYELESENFESIHNHSAYALISHNFNPC